jgi:hypothetical protein
MDKLSVKDNKCLNVDIRVHIININEGSKEITHLIKFNIIKLEILQLGSPTSSAPHPSCSSGLSATRQRYFPIRTNWLTILFSQNKSPATSQTNRPDGKNFLVTDGTLKSQMSFVITFNLNHFIRVRPRSLV